MGPRKALDGDALRANVRAFAALGAPVAAVVKADGYGWGAARIACEIDDLVESYFVADLDELAALRLYTARTIRMLGDAAPGALERVLALGGIPNISSIAALEEAKAAAHRSGSLTVRIGVLDAAGWSTIAPRQIDAIAAACADAPLRVEAWSHITSDSRADAQSADLEALCKAFAARGVDVVSRDLASTGSARAARANSRTRIGIGMFGAALGSGLALQCALRVDANVTNVCAAGELRWAGYGDVPLSPNVMVATLRCGYADGVPRTLVGSAGILSVGMQYTTRAIRPNIDPGSVMNADISLDEMAAVAGITAHELVVGFA